MIKKLFSAIMVLASIQAWGNPIDWNQAERVATRFAQSDMSQIGDVHWNRVNRSGVIASNGNAALYVFNRADGDGFVIVAGDDAAIPILGYSTEGTFSYDNIPSNLRQWLMLSERYVEACANRQGSARAVQQGEPVVAPLLGDILWGQGTPYNDMCPTYDGGTHYYVGCVATAATQIMRYHSFP